MKFTYRSGQRPLDGYTIKRGVGQGGFGEVYFAVSDAGKEVALKLLTRHSDAELRGIAHCLNLKHQNLVHLYDFRADDRGSRWVVMEYVFGESLAQWINRYPTGLPVELVKEWFAAVARGVGYLHDQGIVHRDLKPANVFVENGQLKIGDYGLSRRISLSQGGGLTQGVGTPHYMAPEIKNGNYTLSIDIYACGVILYEMLLGKPPFEGETSGEVMMKHLTDLPDLSRVPAAFAPVLERALEKNPADRFPTIREFLRAVEAVAVGPAGAGAAPKDDGGRATASFTPPAAPHPAAPPPGLLPRAVPVAAGPKFVSGPLSQSYRSRLTQLSGSVAVVPVVAGLCAAPFALFAAAEPWSLIGRVFLLATALSWAALAVGRPPAGDPRFTWGRRFQMLLAGAAVGGLAFWLDGWVFPRGGTPADTSRDVVFGGWARVNPETLSTATRYLFYFGVSAAAVRWWRLADPRRRERFRFLPVVTAGGWGAALMFLWPWEAASPALGVAPVVIAAVCVQVSSPWTPPPPRSIPRGVPVRRRKYHYA